MEPVRALVVESIPLGRRAVGVGAIVWLTGAESRGLVEIEVDGARHRVGAGAVVACPVPRPSLEVLRGKDPCFGLDANAFDEVLREDQQFVFRRCRAHGRLFVEDVRGGIAMYTRTILVENEPADGDLRSTWVRLHRMPDDLLNWLGIAL